MTESSGWRAWLPLWAIRIGALYVAAMAFWRLAITIFSIVNAVSLEVPVAALTFTPIPDAAFCLTFLYLCFFAGRRGSDAYREIGIVAGLLQIIVLVALTITFRRWTDGYAFSFSGVILYQHVVFPCLWCLWLVVYLGRGYLGDLLSKRQRGTA